METSTSKKVLIALAVLVGLVGLYFLWRRKGAASNVGFNVAHIGADRMLGSNLPQQTDAMSIVSKFAHVALPESSPVSAGPVPVGTPTGSYFTTGTSGSSILRR